MFTHSPGLTRLTHKLKALLKQPLFVQFWLIPAWVVLGISKLFILLITFSRLAPRLGQHNGTIALTPLLEKQQEMRALQISRIISIASRYTPWDSNCFPQAVTARILLGIYHIPYVLYFGLDRESETTELQAHAWVVAGRVNVTGGNSFDTYTVVGCFLAPELHELINS